MPERDRHSPRYPWGDFPDVARNGDLGELKAQPEYPAAKGGDDAAALGMANRLIRQEFIEAIAKLGSDHPKPVFLPVLAVESAGKNKIPLALAEVLGARLGWPVEISITQMSRSFKTDSGADHRLTVGTVFDGKIDRDAGYILVDDTLTMGGTIADLRGFVLSRGGQVLGSGVGVAHPGAVHLPVRDKMIHSIESKHGIEAVRSFAQEQWGYGIECLTQGEAGHIRAAVSLDALRTRFAAARNASQQRMDEAGIAAPAHGINQQQSAEEITQPQQSSASARDAAQFQQFVETPTGGLDFGELSQQVAKSIRRQAGPIRLLKEDLQHIENRHGDQIRMGGYPSVVNFVRSTVKECNQIYTAKGGSLALLVHHRGKERFAMIQLQPAVGGVGDSDYYGVKTASLCRDGYLLNREPLLEQDGPILSSLPNPFDPGAKVDSRRFSNYAEVVKGKALPLSRDSPYHTQTPESEHPFGVSPIADKEQKAMAQEQTKLFSYGPVDIQQDPSTRELHISHADMGASATLAPDDSLHQAVLQTIERNPYSKGFTANQVSALIENQDRWESPEQDQEGLSFGPSQEVQQQVEQNATPDRSPPAKGLDEIAKEQERYRNARGISSTEAAKLQEPLAGRKPVEREGLDDAPGGVRTPAQSVQHLDLDTPEGQKLLEEFQAAGFALEDPANYDPGKQGVPLVAQKAVESMRKVQPALADEVFDQSVATQKRLLDVAEYAPAAYDEKGVPQVGHDAAQEIQQQARVLEAQRNFLREHPPLPLPDNILDGLSEEHRKQVSNPRIEYRAYSEREGSRFSQTLETLGKNPENKHEREQYHAIVVADFHNPATGKPEPMWLRSVPEREYGQSSEMDGKQVVQLAEAARLDPSKLAMDDRRFRYAKEEHLDRMAQIKQKEQEKGPETALETPAPEKPMNPETQKALEDWPGSDTKKPEAEREPTPSAPKFERIRPPAILLDNGKGQPHVLDHGDKITVTNRAMFGVGSSAKEKKRQAVEVALSAAAKRFGEPVHFQGTEKFMEETIAVAIQRGIKLEPGNEVAKRMYERALEKIEPNQLGPSKAAQNRAPEKAKAKSKGMEI